MCFAELGFDPFYPQNRVSVEKLALAEPVPGPTTEMFAPLARELGVVLVLNVFERDGERTFDSSPVIDSDGMLLGTTRMVHITECDCFHEQGYYAPGDTGAPVYDTALGPNQNSHLPVSRLSVIRRVMSSRVRGKEPRKFLSAMLI